MKEKRNKTPSFTKEVQNKNTTQHSLAGALKNLKNKTTHKTDDFVSAILKNDIATLSRAITLIESARPEHRKKAHTIIERCLPHAGKSIRIGITGVPGSGKSTFIESLGTLLTTLGKKIAVLTVDPSSSITKGSVLGDKTRMETLAGNPNAYIRPSPSGAAFGGVARHTREAIILCEAAGYDIVIIETVGVGQSETTVHSMTDFFLLLKIAGAGDELQGIKRGIIEMADAIVINKADGDNQKAAAIAKAEFARALKLYPPGESGWTPKALTCSALNNTGVDDIWTLITTYLKITNKNGFFEKKRQKQNQYWLLQTINRQLETHFYTDPLIKTQLKKLQKKMHAQKISPFRAAEIVIQHYFNSKKT